MRRCFRARMKDGCHSATDEIQLPSEGPVKELDWSIHAAVRRRLLMGIFAVQAMRCDASDGRARQAGLRHHKA